MDYYSALRRNKIMLYATSWMHLEDIRLIENRHIQKDNNYINPVIQGPRMDKFKNSES